VEKKNKKIAIMGLGELAEQAAFEMGQKFDNYELVELRTPVFSSHEEYEKHSVEIRAEVAKEISVPGREDFFLFLSADRRTGLSLPLLEEINRLDKGIRLSVILIHMGDLCSDEENIQIERVIFGVFQEMARAAVIHHAFLFDVERLEEIYQVDAGSVSEYYSKISGIVADTMHTRNVCERSQNFGISNLSRWEPKEVRRLEEISRISTFFIFDVRTLESDPRNFFFPVDRASKLVYNLCSDGKSVLEMKRDIRNSERLSRDDQLVYYRIFDLGSDLNIGELFIPKPSY
jgi:hypothetical protein